MKLNYLLEIADKDILFIGLGVLALILFASVIFFVVKKGKKVKPIDEDERYDNVEEYETQNKDTQKEEDLTDDQKEAREELQKVFSQMNEDLQKQKEDPIEDYEKDQEENAVISYTELMKQVEAKKKAKEELENKQKEYKELLQEETETYEYKQKPESHKHAYTKEDALEEYFKKPKEEPKKFHQSEIISPIYGIQKPGEASRPAMDEEYENYKHAYSGSKLSDNDNEFLKDLKDFRNNL